PSIPTAGTLQIHLADYARLCACKAEIRCTGDPKWSLSTPQAEERFEIKGCQIFLLMHPIGPLSWCAPSTFLLAHGRLKCAPRRRQHIAMSPAWMRSYRRLIGVFTLPRYV